MTTVATAEDLTLATDGEVRAARDAAVRLRRRTRSKLVLHRLDAAIAEITEEADERQRRAEERGPRF